MQTGYLSQQILRLGEQQIAQWISAATQFFGVLPFAGAAIAVAIRVGITSSQVLQERGRKNSKINNKEKEKTLRGFLTVTGGIG